MNRKTLTILSLLIAGIVTAAGLLSWTGSQKNVVSSSPTIRKSATIQTNADRKLPPSFTKQKSRTTDLTALSTDETKRLEGFVLDIPEAGTIVFLEPVDLSSSETKQKLANLDNYVEIKRGLVYLDAERLPELNKSARVTLYNLNLVSDMIKVMQDDAEARSLSQFIYDRQTKTLSFVVADWASYSLAPNLRVKQVTPSDDQSHLSIRGTISDLDAEIIIKADGKKISPQSQPIINTDGTFELIVPMTAGQEIDISALAASQQAEQISVQRAASLTSFMTVPDPFRQPTAPLVCFIMTLWLCVLCCQALITFIKQPTRNKSVFYFLQPSLYPTPPPAR